MSLISVVPDAHDNVFEAQQTGDLHCLSLHINLYSRLYFLEADK
jgi:hypothetical protein